MILVLVLVLVLGPWIFVLVLRLSFLAAPHHRDAVNTSLSRAGAVPITVSRGLPISTVLKRPEIPFRPLQPTRHCTVHRPPSETRAPQIFCLLTLLHQPVAGQDVASGSQQPAAIAATTTTTVSPSAPHKAGRPLEIQSVQPPTTRP